MKLVDTNVFIYSAGAPHPYKDSCRQLIQLLGEGEMDGNIDIEVPQELMHFYHSKRRTQEATISAVEALRMFTNPIVVTGATMLMAADILTRCPHLQSRDAVHAAVVLEHNLEGIISTDRGFDNIPGLTRFDPKELVA